MTRNLYCVVYRTGGTENFVWRRSLAFSQHAAIVAKEQTARMGFLAYVVEARSSHAIGLPTTFSPEGGY